MMGKILIDFLSLAHDCIKAFFDENKYYLMFSCVGFHSGCHALFRFNYPTMEDIPFP